MFGFGDLFQWERFITPSMIKVFYGLAVATVALLGLSGAASAMALMQADAFLGLVTLLACVVGAVAGIVLSRIAAEFVLIAFRINENLNAIRSHHEQAFDRAPPLSAEHDPYGDPYVANR